MYVPGVLSFEYFNVTNSIMCSKYKGRENVVRDHEVSVADASGASALPFVPLLISAAATVNSSVRVQHSAHIPVTPLRVQYILSLDCQGLVHAIAKGSPKNREVTVLENTLPVVDGSLCINADCS